MISHGLIEDIIVTAGRRRRRKVLIDYEPAFIAQAVLDAECAALTAPPRRVDFGDWFIDGGYRNKKIVGGPENAVITSVVASIRAYEAMHGIGVAP